MDWPSSSAATTPAGAVRVERSDPVLAHFNDLQNDSSDPESLGQLSPAEIIRTFTTAYKIPSSFTSFVMLSVFALSNTFSMNHYFRKRVNHANELWLGTGASFRVSVYERQHHAWIANPSLPTSQTLVCKMPILRRPGEPYDEKRLASIILELRLLIHPPLVNHESIVSLKGIAWQHSLDSPGVVVPCLLLEFAEYGTLSDLLRGGENIPFKTKLHLLCDIALGLEALHKCGIAQGDVKPDNVLIFKHPTRRFIAKLADFGYSFLEVEEDVYVGGTRSWKAPETIGKSVPRDLLASTDLYSYGLLVWQVMLGKQSVFDHLSTGSRASPLEDLDLMKEKDIVLRKAVDWTCDLDPDYSALLVSLFKATLTRDPKKRSLEDVLRTFWGDDENLPLERAMLTLFPADCRKVIREQTVSFIQVQLREQRNMVLASLRRQGIDAWAPPRKPHETFVWLASRVLDLDPSIQRFLIKDLENAVAGRPSVMPVTRADALGMLGTLHICNPVGRQIEGASIPLGIDYLRQAAKLGSWNAQGIIYRACISLGQPVPEDLPVLAYVKFAVAAGLWDPLQDLARLDLDEYTEALRLRRRSFPIEEEESVKAVLKGSGEGFRQVMLTAQVQCANHYSGAVEMDPIHVAATSGFKDVVEFLINCTGADVNAVTQLMDTPLICASRQGHTSVLRVLLRNGADLTRTNLNNENPLHFLWCFEEADVDPVCDFLIRRGADTTCQAHRRHLRMLEEWDSTHCPGTPLHRAVARNHPGAVRALLRNGADPLLPLSDGSSLDITPIELACRFHCSDALEVLLNHIKQHNRQMIDSTGRPIDNLLLLAIIEAAENFSRHGAEWRNKLAATFDILRHHGADFANCDGLGTHALVVAVTHGHRNVVDIILKNIGSDELRVHRNENHSLLHMALSLGQIQMARHLLKKGADPLAVAGSDNELTVLHELAAGITGEAAAQLAIDLVLHMGVPVDGVDPDYETPLAVALRCLNLPLAEIFLRLGANPNAAFHRRFNYEGEFANTVLGSLVQHPNEAGLHQVEFFLKAAEPFGLSDLAEVENSISALELVAKEMPTRRRLENSFEPPPIHPAAGKSQLRNDGACVKMADLLFRHFTHSRATRALFFAALATNLPVIKYLLQRGVSPSEVMHKPPFFSALEILLRMPLDRSEMLEMPGVVIMPEFIALFFSALRPFDGSSDGHGLDDDFSQSLSFDVAWERVEDAYRELGTRRQWLERELSEVMDGISLQILNLRLRMPFGIPV